MIIFIIRIDIKNWSKKDSASFPRNRSSRYPYSLVRLRRKTSLMAVLMQHRKKSLKAAQLPMWIPLSSTWIRARDSLDGWWGWSIRNGQRRLIAIIRAALANAPALILDEAASSIDSTDRRWCRRDGPLDGRPDCLHGARPPSIDDCQFRCDYGNGPRRRIIEQATMLLDGRTAYYRLAVDLKLINNKSER